MKFLFYILLSLFTLASCGQNSTKHPQQNDSASTSITDVESESLILIEQGKIVKERFQPPLNFQRISCDPGSFGSYLRTLPLKDHGGKVLYYDGSIKTNHGVYDAVIDLPIGKRDLHQCADAIMRLRAEYLYAHEEYEAIHFNFTNGFRLDFSEWMKGKRIIIQRNKVSWIQKTQASHAYPVFRKYLETIFIYAGTLSLSKEMQGIDTAEMKPGDVFIQCGSPGHAVIVIDMAIDSVSGNKLFILAQSYMPAQEIQILTNPNNKNISPWYPLSFGEKLFTPEWTFTKNDLKRFRE